MDDKKRCWWCGDSELYQRYHDREWGVPNRDSDELFELLNLEGAQAGLSWITILKKRENYRKAFDNFDAQAMARYGDDRDALIADDHQGPRPSGGVGGSQAGVKCLHAHYADHAAGNDNPIGTWVASRVEPLNCTVMCAADVEGVVVRNPEWVEPALPGR